MLKISAFYLDKEKSFIPKKIEVYHVPWIALISANFPHPRLWLELPDLDQIWIKVTTLKIFYVTWLGWTGNQIRDWLDWASNWQFFFFWPTFSTKLWSDKINGLFATLSGHFWPSIWLSVRKLRFRQSFWGASRVQIFNWFKNYDKKCNYFHFQTELTGNKNSNQ